VTTRLPAAVLACTLAFGAGVGAGCAPEPTEALVSIELDPSLLPGLDELRVFVDVPADDGGPPVAVHQIPIRESVLELPYVLALVPRGGDPSRTWSVEAQAVPLAPDRATAARLDLGTYREDAVTRYRLLVAPCDDVCLPGFYCLNRNCVMGLPRPL
jgi:hypothetical protein